MSKTVRDTIKDRKQIYCISNQASVAEAARYLKDRAIRAAGVCNLSGKIIGVISQSDISDKVVAENYRPAEVTVASVATPDIVKISLDTLCEDALQTMHQRGIYHLAVEDDEGTFMGMISLRDCITLKVEEEHERAEMLADYAFPRY